MIVGFLVALLAVAVCAAYLIHRERSIATVRLREMERHQRDLAHAHAESRSQERELLNRLAHAYDKPWEEPPVEAPSEPEEELEEMVFDTSHLREFDLVTGSSEAF